MSVALIVVWAMIAVAGFAGILTAGLVAASDREGRRSATVLFLLLAPLLLLAGFQLLEA